MQTLHQLSPYGEFINILASIFGIVGFVFGIWRYFRERKVQEKLEDRQRELGEALSRVKHLEKLASGLTQYSKAV